MLANDWIRLLLITIVLISHGRTFDRQQLLLHVSAEQYVADDVVEADEVEEYVNEYNNKYDNNQNYMDDNGEIVYYTELAILPRRCIKYNDIDVIVWQMFENGYKQCTDTAIGTYVTTVPNFIQGYMNQKAQDAYDQGQDNYDYPDATKFIACTEYPIDDQIYYLQFGCSDETSQEVILNIYDDNACTIRSSIDPSSLTTDYDLSSAQPGFKQCMMCVHWFDRNDDQPEVDDGFYYERKTNSPLCSVPWANREICDTKCQHIRVEKQQRQRWSTSDHILLAILITFGLIMVGLIIRKRNQMSNKDTLLEQAALSASGLQQPHVIGLFVLVVIVIAVFGLLGLKNVTWTLLLIIDTILFAYLMKLTISSSMNSPETIIGPDGTIFRTDSDDSSVGSNGQQTNTSGTYNLPVID